MKKRLARDAKGGDLFLRLRRNKEVDKGVGKFVVDPLVLGGVDGHDGVGIDQFIAGGGQRRQLDPDGRG